MIDIHDYLLFLATAAVLVLSPGPDTVMVLSRTLASGTSAGIVTLLGTQVGNVIHALLAGIGISTLILVVPFALEALKVVGVAYLIYLAVQTWRSPAALDLQIRPSTGIDAGPGRYFLQGLANNLSNPKMIAFFLALFPQFLHPGQGSLAAQSLIMGITLALMALAWIGFVVLLLGRFRAALASSTAALRLVNRLAAVTFVGLACRLAFEDRR